MGRAGTGHSLSTQEWMQQLRWWCGSKSLAWQLHPDGSRDPAGTNRRAPAHLSQRDADAPLEGIPQHKVLHPHLAGAGRERTRRKN